MRTVGNVNGDLFELHPGRAHKVFELPFRLLEL